MLIPNYYQESEYNTPVYDYNLNFPASLAPYTSDRFDPNLKYKEAVVPMKVKVRLRLVWRNTAQASCCGLATDSWELEGSSYLS
jgi:hypothetical protein